MILTSYRTAATDVAMGYLDARMTPGERDALSTRARIMGLDLDEVVARIVTAHPERRLEHLVEWREAGVTVTLGGAR